MNQLNSAQVQHRKSKDESYLSSTQISYLKSKLLIWRQSLLNQMNQTKVFLQSDNHNHGDLLDRASQEEELFLTLGRSQRERKLIKRIEEMIHRVDDKNFGYCKTCGFEIGFSRLKVRPIAEECVDCKQFAEIKERHQRKSQ